MQNGWPTKSHHICGTSSVVNSYHDDVIKWKHFPRYWPFVRGIHRSPVKSPHKGKWRGALMFSLICVWINGWVNNGEAGDFRHHRAHYDVTVMWNIRCTVSDIWIIFGTGNGLSPVRHRAITWPMLSYCELQPLKYFSMKCCLEFKIVIKKMYLKMPSEKWLCMVQQSVTHKMSSTVAVLSCLLINLYHIALNASDIKTYAHSDPGCMRLRISWWRHQMETFSALLALCAGNSPASGEFHAELWYFLWSAPE